MKAVLPTSVLALGQLAEKEQQSRFGTLSHVFIRASGGNHRCEASNGKYLGIINGLAEGDGEFLIPANKMAEIKKILPKNATGVVFETEGKTFRAGGISKEQASPLSTIGGECLLIGDGVRWPQTDQIIPKGQAATTFKLDANLLMDLARVALSVGDGSTVLAFTVFKNNNGSTINITTPIAVTARNEEGTQVFDGIIMPFVEPTRPK